MIAVLRVSAATADPIVWDTTTATGYRAPTGGSFEYVGPAAFTLGANGLLTYSGAPVSVLVAMTTAIFMTLNVAQAVDVGMAISKNGDLLTAQTDSDAAIVAGAGVARYVDSTQYLEMATQRAISLVNGDTLRAIAAVATLGRATDDMKGFVYMTINPLLPVGSGSMLLA